MQPLPPRVPAGELLELGDQLGVASAARSASTRSSTAASCCSSSRATSAGANGKDAISANGGPRHSSSAARSWAPACPPSGRERLAAVGHHAFEALGVEFAGAHAEAVAGRRGEERVGVLERFA